MFYVQDPLGYVRYEEALVYYDRILELLPSSKMAAGYKGLTLCKLKRRAEALQCYEKALGC